MTSTCCCGCCPVPSTALEATQRDACAQCIGGGGGVYFREWGGERWVGVRSFVLKGSRATRWIAQKEDGGGGEGGYGVNRGEGGASALFPIPFGGAGSDARRRDEALKQQMTVGEREEGEQQEKGEISCLFLMTLFRGIFRRRWERRNETQWSAQEADGDVGGGGRGDYREEGGATKVASALFLLFRSCFLFVFRDSTVSITLLDYVDYSPGKFLLSLFFK